MSSFFTAHQHILGYLVPYNDVDDTTKERRCNQGYLATIKYELQVITVYSRVKVEKFWAVLRPQSRGGRLICGSENLPPAIDLVVSQVSCVNSGWLVGGAWSAVVCENLQMS